MRVKTASLYIRDQFTESRNACWSKLKGSTKGIAVLCWGERVFSATKDTQYPDLREEKHPNNTWCSAHPHSRGPCDDEPWLRWRFVFAEPWAGSVLVPVFRHRAQLQLNCARVEVPSHYLTKVFPAPWVSTAQIWVSHKSCSKKKPFPRFNSAESNQICSQAFFLFLVVTKPQIFCKKGWWELCYYRH